MSSARIKEILMVEKSLMPQLKNMFRSIGFKFCCILVLLASFSNTILMMLPNYGGYADYMIDINSSSVLCLYAPLNDYFYIGSLLIFAIPYGLSNTKRHSRFEQLKLDTSYKDYCIGGLIVSFIGTFLAFFLPLLLNNIVSAFFFGDSGILGSGFTLFEYNGTAGMMGVNYDESILNPGYAIIPLKLMIEHPLIYNICYSLLFSFIIGIIAAYMFQLSFYFKYKIMMIPIPVIGYYLIIELQSFITEHFGKSYELIVFRYLTIMYNMNLSKLYLPLFVIFLMLMIGCHYIHIKKLKGV